MIADGCKQDFCTVNLESRGGKCNPLTAMLSLDNEQ